MFQHETLTNGVRLLTAQQDQSPSATALVMFGVGSRFEQAHQSGIAHFAEHMFFKGTERRPTARDISVEIDGIGGDFNAFTGKEYTGYYVKCAAEHLDLAVDVLADMLLHSNFDPEEIEREKGVILEEMAMYRDLPQRYVGNVYDELLYGDTPLGWDIIGTEEVIKGADRDLFKGFTDHWYAANRTVIGLSGNVSASAKAAVSEKFLGLPSANEGTRESATWEQDGPRVKLHHKDSEQAHLLLGVRSIGLMHEDRYALGVMNAILGGGMSSRLFTEVRERRGLCYYVYSHHDAYTDAGSLVVAAGVDTGRIDLAIQSRDQSMSVRLAARETPDFPASSCFRTLAESSAFFEPGSVGFSVTRDCCRLDGIRLDTHHWKVQNLAVENVESSFFDNPAAFPPGSATFDHALIMRDIPHDWHEVGAMTLPATA